MTEKLYVVYATTNIEDFAHQVVGIFSTQENADNRLTDFPYGYVLSYVPDEIVPFNPS